jgi:hypothetical protein
MNLERSLPDDGTVYHRRLLLSRHVRDWYGAKSIEVQILVNGHSTVKRRVSIRSTAIPGVGRAFPLLATLCLQTVATTQTKFVKKLSALLSPFTVSEHIDSFTIQHDRIQ